MKKRMIVDTANLLFRVASAHTKYSKVGTPEEQAGLCLHMALQSLRSHYNRVKPDELALTFEGRDNWRKTYTKSPECISQRVYKANRVRDDSILPFIALIGSFEEMVRAHTSLICLSHPTVEGDDMFAGYVERYTAEGDEVYGLSGDKDFIQLYKHKGFTLLNPDKAGPARNVDKKGAIIDPEFFMFEKAFRGDTGDNVMSAFPRVRLTRLQEAYRDEYKLTNLMNEEWDYADPTTGVIRRMNVSKLFHENQLLMNLSGQPQYIRDLVQETITRETANRGKFDFFHFQKFCGKHKLKKIAEESAGFTDMLSLSGRSERLAVPKVDVLAEARTSAKRRTSLTF